MGIQKIISLAAREKREKRFRHQLELKLFSNTNKPLAYFRYVDDTFAAFNNEDDCYNFFTHLNSLHLSLSFTQQKQSNSSLSFLDVLVERKTLIL